MINRNGINIYKSIFISNKFECITAAGLYCTTHGAKVLFSMPDFSRSKNITHRLNIDTKEEELGIGYEIMIGQDLTIFFF